MLSHMTLPMANYVADDRCFINHIDISIGFLIHLS